jgi:trehalose synthase
VNEEQLVPLEPQRFRHLLNPARAAQFDDALSIARRELAGTTFWHINSTAAGGGVAELLQSVLCYLPGAGINTRWLVIDGDEQFFEITKRIHKLLHGEPAGAQLLLGDRERATYEAPLNAQKGEILRLVRAGDRVILHDPQTLGLAPALAGHGAKVIWTCHVGSDIANENTRSVWDFLRTYVAATYAQVFSRPQYIWEGLDPTRSCVIPPCLDAFSPKNQLLAADTVDAILAATGVFARDGHAAPAFRRQDGAEAVVENRATLIESAPLPHDAAVVCQVSRWDPLKDHAGVMRAFAAHVPAAHLLLAGPSPEAVTDDPEGQSTFDELHAAWQILPDDVRERVHLCSLPMGDVDENAAIVNALQRRSNVVVQKSVAEGFGLTVAEAMWKGRPVVGSRVGGIQDQIEDGVSGLLVEPDDDAEFGTAVTKLLRDNELARAVGDAGHARVGDEYLAPRFLCRYLQLVS